MMYALHSTSVSADKNTGTVLGYSSPMFYIIIGRMSVCAHLSFDIFLSVFFHTVLDIVFVRLAILSILFVLITVLIIFFQNIFLRPHKNKMVAPYMPTQPGYATSERLRRYNTSFLFQCYMTLKKIKKNEDRTL